MSCKKLFVSLACKHLLGPQIKLRVKKKKKRGLKIRKNNEYYNSMCPIYSVLASSPQLNYDDNASSAHAKDDALSSTDTDVSIPLSSMVFNSCIQSCLLGSGWMHSFTTSHITLRSSYLKCFNTGSTT